MSFLESDELQQRLFKSLFTYVLLSFVAWALGPLFFTLVFPFLGLNQWDLFLVKYPFMSISTQTISLMPVLLGWLRFVRYHYFYLDPTRFCRADYDLLVLFCRKQLHIYYLSLLTLRNFYLRTLRNFQASSLWTFRFSKFLKNYRKFLPIFRLSALRKMVNRQK